MMDEVKFFYDRYDLRKLKLQTPNVDFHFAINPIGEWCEKQFEPIFPEDENTIIWKLDSPHRNCFEIAIFLLHLNALIDKDPRKVAKSLSTQDNNPIHQTCISSGVKPLWVTVNDQLADETILNGIKYEMESSIEDVALLYRNGNHIVHDWCEKQNWKFIHNAIITGSEASTIVLYKVNASLQYIKEFYSRTKLRFIIIQE